MKDAPASLDPQPTLAAPAVGDGAVPPRPALAALLGRERAVLEFNRRVLAQASRADVPLLERLRYVCIVSSNLDEFFEIRFGDLLDSARARGDALVGRDVERVAADAHALIDEQYRVFNDEVMPRLQRAGVVILNHAERDASQRRWVDDFFQRQVRPLLVPVGLDPAHPFPQVANKSLNFIVRLSGKDAFGRANSIAIVKVPRVLPRVIRLPAALTPGRQGFVLLTSVIRAHLAELFPGREVEAFSQFRVTRDADLEVDEDDVTNLRQALRTGLSRRHYGQAIRLEVVASCPAELSGFLLQQFELPEAALYQVNGPVNLVRLNQLIDQVSTAEANEPLRFPAFEPRWPESRLPREGSVFATLRERDVLLHHPFQPFTPVMDFLRQAAADPHVLAIKQTLYRTGTDSSAVEALVAAAHSGKDVTVVIELRARFDEEANIELSNRLQEAGAHVMYGVVGYKTHAKLALVVRRESDGIRRYCHLGTGNYHSRTARGYTDYGLFTCDPDIGQDVHEIFLQLTSLTQTPRLSCLLQSPFGLHAAMLEKLEREAAHSRAGRAARVILKMNSLAEPQAIQALYRASCAGVEIDLIVRGICALRPGIPGVSENIRVRSVVGRFLEHSRVFYFENGGSPEMYCSSADWMERNFFRRVEIAFPVRREELRGRILRDLETYLWDNTQAWVLDRDGQYTRAAAGTEPAVDAQAELLETYAAGGGSAED